MALVLDMGRNHDPEPWQPPAQANCHVGANIGNHHGGQPHEALRLDSTPNPLSLYEEELSLPSTSPSSTSFPPAVQPFEAQESSNLYLYNLVIVQEPTAVVASLEPSEERFVISPSPIVRLFVTNRKTGLSDPDEINYPYNVVYCELWNSDGTTQPQPQAIGVGSPSNDADGAFSFPGLSYSVPGCYRLRFYVMRMDPTKFHVGHCMPALAEKLSNVFTVLSGNHIGVGGCHVDQMPSSSSRLNALGLETESRLSANHDGNAWANIPSESNERALFSRQELELGDDGKEFRASATDPRPSAHSRKLACPFHKRWRTEPPTSNACVHPGFPEISRLKEHLYRIHGPKSQCPRCLELFSDPNALKKHAAAANGCIPRQDPLPNESLTFEQVSALRNKRGARNASKEEKWKHIYHILFPDTDDKAFPSPYVERCPSGQDLKKHLERVLRSSLQHEIQVLMETDAQFAGLEKLLRGDALDKIVRESVNTVFEDCTRTSYALLPTENPCEGVMSWSQQPGSVLDAMIDRPDLERDLDGLDLELDLKGFSD